MRAFLVALALSSCRTVPTTAPALACPVDDLDARWRDGLGALWSSVSGPWKHVAQAPALAVLFDERCVYQGPLGATPAGVPHHGAITLPTCRTITPGVTSFTTASSAGTVFVMALPSVWRAKGVSSKRVPHEVFLEGVAAHELTHVLQSAWATRQLEALEARGLSAQAGDDDAQDALKHDAEARRHFEVGSAALFSAAEVSRSAAAPLVRQALCERALRRRALSEVAKAADDVFVSLEGVGQLALLRRLRATVPTGVALADARRDGSYWTQEEGLGFALVLEAHAPSLLQQAVGDDAVPLPTLVAQAFSVAAPETACQPSP